MADKKDQKPTGDNLAGVEFIDDFIRPQYLHFKKYLGDFLPLTVAAGNTLSGVPPHESLRTHSRAPGKNLNLPEAAPLPGAAQY
ncbi:MAG: hypothetical protein LBP22_09775 [Deltaproteobacteria bacterium]|nr:hypothetical protein [Deltaproteobacteria bacterium]